MDGSNLSVELGLRGNSRLKKTVCRYPPLKVVFTDKKTGETIFRGEGDLKLVVLCKTRKSYADYLRLEFLIYKALNILTPLSYRVRWVDVNYIERGGKQLGHGPAFFVERKKNLAKRNGLKSASNVNRLAPDQLDGMQASLLNLFQYMIGNTDYSLIRSIEPRECCHNAKLLISKERHYFPVVYDFDNSGLINASYAHVADNLSIRRVTTRLYRGYCRDRSTLAAANRLIQQHKQQILSLFADDEVLNKSGKVRALKFLTTSFNWLSTPSKYERKILNKCR